MDAEQMWTIMGIGLVTVFTCLFALIIMIVALRTLLEGAERRRRPPTAVVAATSEPRAAEPPVMRPEILAVIAAAVAAVSGLPPSGVRIASVAPSSPTTPVWGLVSRLNGSLR